MPGWRTVTGQEAVTLERELARELPAGHVLNGRPVVVRARRDDRDVIACAVAELGLCLVHLTWQVETDPRWPGYELVDQLPVDD